MMLMLLETVLKRLTIKYLVGDGMMDLFILSQL